MRLVDLHCDTLYKSVTQNLPINDPSFEVKIEPKNSGNNVLRCFAIWSPDSLTSENAEKLFLSAHEHLKNACKLNNIKLIKNGMSVKDAFCHNDNTAFFTVENSLPLNGKIENVKRFSEMGVRMMSLTWNAHNDAGDGAEVENAKGITSFGKAVVSVMENYGIIIDLSHSSDQLFYDTIENTEKPVVASHSNSRSVTNNKRNLTDEQFKIIVKRKGIVGLNFHKNFLSDEADEANMSDILRHADRFLSLGGENNICIGSDFDGCDLPNDIKGSNSMYEIYDMFLKNGYSETLVNKIFYENALNFFENFDI